MSDGHHRDAPPIASKAGISQLREGLARYAHNAWAGWNRYLFSLCTENSDGSLTIPTDKVQRWRRQIDTPYDELPEDEKESDRLEADKMLNVNANDEIKRTHR